ncbi:metal ABC transporter permease [Desulforamulus aquiferis]|uniref:Metal ABC transporter permease n=1 Tax=Desulforamulus aquiferis TaxID=1397668 RepID=A0AAW7ZGC4_9FIRM|nr:metal ABC transporter permease [Desulforamulus aquiferis]MDO7788753.1 metal ABC transporter permease [Desulforamulus aquiferis]RYD05355.1 metal ABC transporter permease [Desulforamulus aquiferis]
MEIFQYEFMHRAFLAGIIIGLICPVVGLFVALRRMSMISDALSHVCLAGVAAGLFSGSNPIITASAFAIAGALTIEKLREKFKTYSEISIAITLSTGVALGAILLDLGKGYNANFMSYLFGSIVAINTTDVIIIAISGLLILGLIFLLKKELFFISFDEEGASLAGLPVKAITIAFTVLTALTIAVAIRVVGILLVSSLIVLPVAASMRIAKSFRGALLISVIMAEVAVIIGLFASFYINLAPGGAIVMTSVILLLGTLALCQRQYNPVKVTEKIAQREDSSI